MSALLASSAPLEILRKRGESANSAFYHSLQRNTYHSLPCTCTAIWHLNSLYAKILTPDRTCTSSLNSHGQIHRDIESKIDVMSPEYSVASERTPDSVPSIGTESMERIVELCLKPSKHHPASLISEISSDKLSSTHRKSRNTSRRHKPRLKGRLSSSRNSI
jgi:hypothetical protein